MADSFFYLGPWRWLIDGDDWGPRWAAPEGAGSLIDLRTIPQMSRAGGAPEGVGIFVTDRPLNSDYTLLGKAYGDNLTSAHKSAWQALVGKRPERSRINDVLWDALTAQADPRGEVGPKPLMPCRNGVIEMHLAGTRIAKAWSAAIAEWPKILELLQIDYARHYAQCLLTHSDHYLRSLTATLEKYPGVHDRQIQGDLPDEKPLPHNTSFADNFNRGNENLEDSANWAMMVFQSGSLAVFNNKVRPDSRAANANFGQHQTSLSTDDHYAEIDVTTLVAPLSSRSYAGAAIRLFEDGSGLDAYTWQATIDSATTIKGRLEKFVNSVATTLADNVQSWTTGDTYQGSANGTTIKGHINAVEKESVTDSSISGVLQTGMLGRIRRGSVGDVEIDNFEAADLAAFVPYPHPRYGMTGGMQPMNGGV